MGEDTVQLGQLQLDHALFGVVERGQLAGRVQHSAVYAGVLGLGFPSKQTDARRPSSNSSSTFPSPLSGVPSVLYMMTDPARPVTHPGDSVPSRVFSLLLGDSEGEGVGELIIGGYDPASIDTSRVPMTTVDVMPSCGISTTPMSPNKGAIGFGSVSPPTAILSQPHSICVFNSYAVPVEAILLGNFVARGSGTDEFSGSVLYDPNGYYSKKGKSAEAGAADGVIHQPSNNLRGILDSGTTCLVLPSRAGPGRVDVFGSFQSAMFGAKGAGASAGATWADPLTSKPSLVFQIGGSRL